MVHMATGAMATTGHRPLLLAALLPGLASAATIRIGCAASGCVASLADAAVLVKKGRCTAPCTLAFSGSGILGPQSVEQLHGIAASPILITTADGAPRQVLSGAAVPSGDGLPLLGRPYDALLSLRNCTHVVRPVL